MAYTVNPNRNNPWNGLPYLPIDNELFRTLEIYEQLAKAKGALGQVQGRSVALPGSALGGSPIFKNTPGV